MAIPVDITVRDIEKTDAIETRILEKTEKLDRFFDRVESCKVVIEQPSKRQHQGKLYSTHIQLLVPGKKLVVNGHENEDLYLSIRDAYNAMYRQLEEYARKLRGDIKVHLETHSGTIARLFTGYGFITGFDGREFYFDEANVAHPDFESLQIGMDVHYIEVEAGDTLRASQVTANNGKPNEA